MANIMINKNCNLNCPYCFANEFVNKEKDIMNMENFKKAVDFIIKSNIDCVGIIGGEPTIHPEINNFLEYLVKNPKINKIYFYTNGLCINNIEKYIAHPKVSCLVNLNSPKDIGKSKFDKIVDSLDKLYLDLNLDNKITLGINMYKTDFDYEYMIDLLKKYNRKKVRTAIAVPNEPEKRNIDMIEYFLNMKPRVFEFFNELKKIGVMPIYDCNLMPICITDQEEKEWLSSFWELEKNTNERCNITDHSYCSPVIDILPDLTVVRCFGCSELVKGKLDNFCNLTEVNNFFINEIDSYGYQIPASKYCINCKYRKTMQCTGGCFAFKSNKIIKVKEYIKNNCF